MLPGPVRLLEILWDGRLLLTGDVYEFGSDDLTVGTKYSKVIRTEDGKNDLQFLQLYPAEILIMKAVPGYGALFSAEGIGLAMWNTLDADGLSWTQRTENPKYLAAGADGQVLVVGKDAKSLKLLRAFDGYVLASVVLDDGVVGEPLPYEGRYFIPQKGKIAVLDNNLFTTSVLKVEGLSGQAVIKPIADGFFIADGQSVWKITHARSSNE